MEDKRLKNGSLEEENKKNGSLENVGLEDKLLDLLRQNPEINVTDLSCSLDIGKRTCYRVLEKLKSKGIIERVGGRRYGCWKVK